MADKTKKASLFSRAGRYIRDIRAEAKKVHWPTKKQLTNNTAIVLVMVIAIGIFIWIADVGMGFLTNLMLRLSA